ncbi:MAG: hypothetical protein CMO97_02060 [Woeseia sp.]|nr:hypothetical protein [Woeseia sp.]|tara:strand:+ start:1690 stop:1992 length:303 start_codon:yes stop_codon:yes gene_type:complete
MSNINVIETLAHTLNDSELSDAIQILVKARNARQKSQLLEMKSSLLPGDTVEFYHSQKGKYIRGTVKKTKTKKALIVEEGANPMQRHLTWDVPMGMLKKC